jgi:hypothetical protein
MALITLRRSPFALWGNQHDLMFGGVGEDHSCLLAPSSHTATTVREDSFRTLHQSAKGTLETITLLFVTQVGHQLHRHGLAYLTTIASPSSRCSWELPER